MRGKNSLKDINNLRKPGPGSYDPNTTTSEKKISYTYSFGSSNRQESNKKSGVPGPGNYGNDINPIRKKSPSLIFGQAKRSGINIIAKNPGPGSYATNINTIKPEAPQHR